MPMKKLTIAFALIALLTFTFAITVFADGNIAEQATVTTNASHWHVVGNGGWAKNKITNLNDGKYETGVPACAKSRIMYVYFEFETEQQIDRIVLHCNGSGEAGNIGQWSNINANRNIGIYVHDANGKVVFEKWLNTLDKTELEYKPDSPVMGKKVTLRFDSDYNAEYALLRELEIFDHTCLFNTLKETIKQPTCIDNGIGLYECSCGKTEEQPLLATGEHIYTDIDALTYENGFLAKGKKLFGCPTCDDYIEKEELPIFKFLGYSISHSGKSICAGYVVDKDILDEYTKINSITIDYGMLFAVTDQADIVNPNATLKENINGNIMSLINEDYSRFDIRITANDWTNILDTPLVMCCYIVEGEKVTYICSNTNTDGAIPISYNHLNFMPI